MIITDNGSFLEIGSRGIHKSNVLLVDYDTENVYLISGKRSMYRNAGPSDITIPFAAITSPQNFASSLELRDWLLGVLSVGQSLVITSATTFEIPENTTAVGQITCNLAGATFAKYGSGANNSLFAVSESGLVTITAQSFETLNGAWGYNRLDDGTIEMNDLYPELVDGPGNAYELTVRATKDGQTADQTIIVCISDVYEALSDPTIFAYAKGALEQKSDGWYMPDTIGTNDLKIVKSNAFRFSAANSYAINSNVSVLNINDGHTYEFIWLLAFNNLTQTNKYLCTLNGTKFTVQFHFDGTNAKIKVSASDGWGYNPVITSVFSISNTNFGTLKITVVKAAPANYTQNRLKIDFTGMTQEVYQSTNGWTIQNTLTAGTFLLGNNGACADHTVIAFWHTTDGVEDFYLPFSQHTAGSTTFDCYERHSGANQIVRNGTNVDNNDIHPENVLNGFEKWVRTASPYDTWFMPKKSDGSRIVTALTGFISSGIFDAGNGLNYSESKLSVNGTDYTCSELTAYPFTNKATKFNATLISEVMAFTENKTLTQLEAIFSYLGYTIFAMSGFVGDSIMHGIAANFNELDGSFTDPVNEKIWDIATQSWQNFTRSNCQQPVYGFEKAGTITVNTLSDQVVGTGTSFTALAIGDQITTSDQVNNGGRKIGIIKSIESNTSLTLEANSLITVTGTYYRVTVYKYAFCCDLGMAAARGGGRSAEYAIGGAVLRDMWQATSGHNAYWTLWAANVIVSIRAALIEGLYPHWTGMYIALGTNDCNESIMTLFSPSWPDSRDNIETYATALILNLRALYGEQVPIHWLLPRRIDANRNIGVIELKKITEPAVYFYSSDDLTYGTDQTHPNTIGTLEEGENFFFESYESSTD